MTRDEFYVWRKEHFAAFTSLVSWHKGLEDSTETMRHWFRELSGCEPKDAQRATRYLYSQQDRDLYFPDHPAAVRRLCEFYVQRRTPTPSTTYRPPSSGMPSLHADYSQQLDAWLAMPAAEQHELARRHYSSDFERSMVLGHDRCLRCDRDHGHDFFLMGLFDLMVGVPQPAAEVSE